MQDGDAGRVHNNYRQNYERLRAVKRTYDPHSVSDLNQNIAP